MYSWPSNNRTILTINAVMQIPEKNRLISWNAISLSYIWRHHCRTLLRSNGILKIAKPRTWLSRRKSPSARENVCKIQHTTLDFEESKQERKFHRILIQKILQQLTCTLNKTRGNAALSSGMNLTVSAEGKCIVSLPSCPARGTSFVVQVSLSM